MVPIPEVRNSGMKHVSRRHYHLHLHRRHTDWSRPGAFFSPNVAQTMGEYYYSPMAQTAPPLGGCSIQHGPMGLILTCLSLPKVLKWPNLLSRYGVKDHPPSGLLHCCLLPFHVNRPVDFAMVCIGIIWLILTELEKDDLSTRPLPGPWPRF